MKKTKIKLLTCAVFGSVALAAVSLQAQSLPVTNGLQLWLTADLGVTTNSNGLVTAWADQSGNNNNAVQTNTTNAPTLAPKALNGHAVVNFPGDTRFLDVADSSSIAGLVDDVTILVVAKYDDLSTYRGVVAKTRGNTPAPFDWWNNQRVAGGLTYFWLGDGTAFAGYTSATAPSVGSYNVLGFAWSSGVLAQYLNDLSNGQFTYTVTPADAGTPLRIGSRDDLVTQLKGDVAEVLIYQPALSDADRNAVIAYLHAKYALNFKRPPVVTIASPTNGTTVAVSSVLPVSVNVSPTGTMARVDLLVNGVLLASAAQSPYQTELGLPNPGVLTLVAVATSTNGLAATSAPVSITVTGATPATPVAAGLRMWLRADAGVTTNSNGLVTRWADQSGRNDAVQSDPTAAPLLVAGVASGHPGLSFGTNQFSANQFLEVSDAGTAFTTGDFSTFVVARFTDFASYRVLWTKSFSGVAAPLDWWFSPNGGVPNVFRGDGITQGGPVAGIQPAPAGQLAIVGLTAQSTTLTHYLGLAANGTGMITTAPASAGETLRIGSRDDGGTQMKGDIAEILIYDHALSDTDRSNTVRYLGSKYGLAQAVSADQSPLVAITSPPNGASLAAPTTIPFTVAASDPDGTVTRVDFLANGVPLASVTNSPFQVNIDLLTPGRSTLAAVATDNWGVQTTSAPVVLTVTGSSPEAPATHDLRLWLRADAGVTTNTDGTVAEWDDGSGNGNNALQVSTAPLLVAAAVNGKPALRFDGVDAYLEVSNAPSIEFAGDISSYAVVRYDDFNGYRALWAKTLGNQPASVDYYLLPGSGIPRFFRGNGVGSAGSVDGSSAPLAGAYLIVGFEMAGTTATHYLNGAANGSGQITATLADGGKPLKIGTRDDLFTMMKGDIADLLVFGHALSDTERSQVLGYLSSKYGLPLVRLANRPPVVTLTSPTDGSTAAVAGLLSVAAQASSADSPISRVDFLANGSLVASQTAPPYQISLQVWTPGALTLQARATSVRGAVGTSAPVVVTVTGTNPVVAPPTAGLLLWLKADAGVTTNSSGQVSTWADQSGNGNNAAPPDPSVAPLLRVDAQTGKPALEFNGTTNYLDVANPNLTLPAQVSSFFAGRVADFSTPRAVWGKTLNGRPRPWDFYIAPGGTMNVLRGNTDGADGVASASPLPANQFSFGGFTVQGSQATLYFDGQVVGTGSFGYGALDSGTPLRIGSRDDLATQFAGSLGELLIYGQGLSAGDLQTVNTYLAGRYGFVLVQVVTVTQPTLNISRTGAGTVQLSWPPAQTGFVLESKTNLASGTWIPMATNPPGNQVTLSVTNAAQFFRLRSE